MPLLYDIQSDRPCCFGLWKVRQCVGFALGLTALGLCLVLRPVQKESIAADATLGVCLLCASFWVFEVIPIYITALLPMALLPLFRVTSAEIVASAYWNSMQMLFLAIFLVEVALEEVRLPEYLALNVLLRVGVMRPSVLLLGTMATCWFLSMLITNIAVALMIAPFVVSLANATEDIVRDQSLASSDTEDSSSPGARGKEDPRVNDVRLYSRGLLVSIAYSSTIGGMATLTGSVSNRLLVGLDLLSGQVTWLRWFAYAAPMSLATLLLAYVVLLLRFVRRVKTTDLCTEHLWEDHRALVEDSGRMMRDMVLVGFVQLSQVVALVLFPAVISPIVTTEYGVPLPSDAVVALVPAVLLFFVPSQRRPGRPVLAWSTVQEKLDFGVLLLIGGGFALSKGFSESGLDQVVGEHVAQITNARDDLLVSALVLFVGSVATQVLSAVGCAVTLLPVLNAASAAVVENPLRLALPGAISCSLSFCLPMASPANVVVLAKSQGAPKPLRVTDFLSAGLPLNFLAIVVCSLICKFWGEVVFQVSDPFPLAACGPPVSNCLFLQVPGVVEGHFVSSQACMMLDEFSDTKCRLWNGTVLDVEDFGGPEALVPEPEPVAVSEAQDGAFAARTGT